MVRSIRPRDLFLLKHEPNIQGRVQGWMPSRPVVWTTPRPDAAEEGAAHHVCFLFWLQPDHDWTCSHHKPWGGEGVRKGRLQATGVRSSVRPAALLDWIGLDWIGLASKSNGPA